MDGAIEVPPIATTAELDDAVAEFAQRRLDHVAFPYMSLGRLAVTRGDVSEARKVLDGASYLTDQAVGQPSVKGRPEGAGHRPGRGCRRRSGRGG